jgi:predicted MPP superfamily phosphohydrolase
MSLLHLGDLHVERTTRRERDLNRMISDLRPDLILFSGDFLNLSYIEDPIAINHTREIISQWKAPLGVFAVSGSEAVDLDHIFPNLVSDLPLRWLKQDVVHLEKEGGSFVLTGLSCSHRPFRDAPVLEKLAQIPQGGFSILVYHSPDLAPNAAELDYDLQLSGHTHGGQVCLPFWGPLFTASLYGRRFKSGRYSIGNLTLYITRGIGMEGKGAPRIRFLCPPEVILWEITGTGKSVNTPSVQENNQ